MATIFRPAASSVSPFAAKPRRLNLGRHTARHRRPSSSSASPPPNPPLPSPSFVVHRTSAHVASVAVVGGGGRGPAGAPTVEEAVEAALAATDPEGGLPRPGPSFPPAATPHLVPPPPPPPRGCDDRSVVRHRGLFPLDLLALGSVARLSFRPPPETSGAGARKPRRLSERDAAFALEEGDALEVHVAPRRFPATHAVDWGRTADGGDKDEEESGAARPLPGAIVREDLGLGYAVLNKPRNVPVHASADNVLENVASAFGLALHARTGGEWKGRRRKGYDDNLDWVHSWTLHRLDQSASGLLVVATKRRFASYFAGLLGEDAARGASEAEENAANDRRFVRKRYRLLVCVPRPPSSDPSILRIDLLRDLASSTTAVRHFLKDPAGRPPRTFAEEEPSPHPGDGDGATWQRCLLKIADVGREFPLSGSEAARRLSESLWGDGGANTVGDGEDSGIAAVTTRRPEGAAAVAEVEVLTLTDCTHQVRGQMAALGFPVVGDVPYGGGAVVVGQPGDPSHQRGVGSDRLALQCCRLSFPKPEEGGEGGGAPPRPSGRRLEFRLEGAWWTPHLARYEEERGD